MKKVNGQKVYYQHYYADAAHNRYRHAREASYYLKLDSVSDDFLRAFTEAMRENQGCIAWIPLFIPIDSNM